MERLLQAKILRRVVYFTLTICCIGLLVSCELEPGMDQTISLSGNAWPEKQQLQFSFNDVPKSQNYQLWVNIRQNNDYPFYNCYFLPSILDAQGKVIKKALAEAIFYDPQTGKPKGQGVGDMYSHSYLIFNALPLKKGGKYTIRLNQFMRKDTLNGMISIGVKLKPIEDGKN